jgi:hypothetical protein
MSMKQITWSNERRKLSDLIPWQRNPRQIEDAQAERLVDSVETFGQVETLAIGPDDELYNGHQRLSVLAGQYGMDYEVDVRVASRPLTEKEREKLTVYLHKGAAGDWNWAALAEWSADDLLAWGFTELDLGIAATDDNEWGSAMGGLPTEDKAPFQQMTFTLHDSQAEQVKRAIAIAGKMGDFADSPNQNSNGNALAFICETFVTDYANG